MTSQKNDTGEPPIRPIFPLHGNFSTIFEEPATCIADVLKEMSQWLPTDQVMDDFNDIRVSLENSDFFKTLNPVRQNDVLYSLRQLEEVVAALNHYYIQPQDTNQAGGCQGAA